MHCRGQMLTARFAGKVTAMVPKTFFSILLLSNYASRTHLRSMLSYRTGAHFLDRPIIVPSLGWFSCLSERIKLVELRTQWVKLESPQVHQTILTNLPITLTTKTTQSFHFRSKTSASNSTLTHTYIIMTLGWNKFTSWIPKKSANTIRWPLTVCTFNRKILYSIENHLD